MNPQNQDFYQELRVKLSAGPKRMRKNEPVDGISIVCPDLFHLLCKLMLDKEVMIADKAKLAGDSYYVSPLDFIRVNTRTGRLCR